MEYQSAEIGKIAEALAKAQGEMESAKKDSKGNYGKYTTISSILEVVKDALSKYSLAVVQAPIPCEAGSICLRTTLMHSSGQWVASELTLKADGAGPQKMGSVITYARRYALAALLGVGQEDDDAQSVQDDVDRRKTQTRQQQSTSNGLATPETRKAVIQAMEVRGIKEPQACLAELSNFFGRDIKNTKDLLETEAKEYINACHAQDNPF
jgi:hypothetical protein